MIQELVSTPEGATAAFMFLLGGVLVLGICLAVGTSTDVRHMMSEIWLGGIKCKSCKKRLKPMEQWVHWTDKKGETDYTGWVWCPFCGAKRYEGFQDRCF